MQKGDRLLTIVALMAFVALVLALGYFGPSDPSIDGPYRSPDAVEATR
jgi:hypothetical protein